MRKSRHIEVRKILIDNPDGMTATELSDLMEINLNVTIRAMKAMPDVYIDRWIKKLGAKTYSAVWCRGDIPENCPKPTKD